MDDLVLGIDTAVPCGLILNELVSNALDHGFPGATQGVAEDGDEPSRPRVTASSPRIQVWFGGGEPGELVLKVKDNGIGLPPPSVLKQQGGLGLEVVATLVEQLGGKLTIKREGGTCVTIRFPEKKGQ